MATLHCRVLSTSCHSTTKDHLSDVSIHHENNIRPCCQTIIFPFFSLRWGVCVNYLMLFLVIAAYVTIYSSEDVIINW